MKTTAWTTRPARTRARGGFTLVEMLTVVVIVSLLAALSTFGVMAAMRAARRAAIRAEIDLMSQAMDKFKNEHLAYPPCDMRNTDGQKAALAFLQRSFTRYRPADFAEFTNHVRTTCQTVDGKSRDVSQMDPSETLVFWLSGMPATDRETKVLGFNRNHEKPFGGTNVPWQEKPGVHVFDASRLEDRDGDGWWEFYPQGGARPAYVYFNADLYTLYNKAPSLKFSPQGGIGRGKVGPYLHDRPDGNAPDRTKKDHYCNSNSFQILSAGLDDDYGKGEDWPVFPSSQNYGDGDNDNLSNFTSAELISERP